MRIETWELVNSMVVASAETLFESLGLPPTYAGSVPHQSTRWCETIAVIGLGGKLQGTLVLSIPKEIIKRTHPTGGVFPEDLADWLAELANLLLGGVKSRFMDYGIGIELSTPLTVSGTTFRFERFVGKPNVHEFRAGGHLLHIMFEATTDAEFCLAPPRPDVVASAGEMITF